MCPIGRILPRAASRLKTEVSLSEKPHLEYRVRHRRLKWSVNSAEKATKHVRRAAALHRIARLRDTEKLHGPAIVTLEVRKVIASPWVETEIPARLPAARRRRPRRGGRP